MLIDKILFVHDIQNPYIDDVTARVTFTDVVLGLMKIPDADIYVTGSNSKMLSSEVLTQFRDRGDKSAYFPCRLPNAVRPLAATETQHGRITAPTAACRWFQACLRTKRKADT